MVAQLTPNIAYVSDGETQKHRHREKWLDHDRNGIGQGNGALELTYNGSSTARDHLMSRSRYKGNGWAGSDNPGMVVSSIEPEYQNLPWVPADPSSFQFGGYRRKALSQVKPHEELEPVEYDHPLRRLVENPNPWDTWFDLVYESQMYLELCGVNYLWAVPNDYGVPCELWVIPAHWVWPRTGGSKYVPPDNPHADELIQYYEVRPWGGMGSAGIIKIPPDEIIMEYWKSPINKIDGYSKLSASSLIIDTNESQWKCNWAQLQNQALPSCFVELPPDFEDPDDARARRLQARFMDHLQGEYNMGKPFVGLAGMKLSPLSFSPESMMYGATEEHSRDMILSTFRVPGAAVGLVKDMTYGSVLSTLASMCEGCINPRLRMRGEKWTKALAPKFERGREFDGRKKSIRMWYDSCLDPETECLTSAGWKRQDELTMETRIACYDDETNTIIYRKPKRIIRKHHEGVLYLWKGQRLDVAMTPDHRVWTKKRFGDWSIKQAVDVFGSPVDHTIRRAAPAACDAPTAIGIDRYVRDNGKRWRPLKFDGKDYIDPRLWLEFVGYYVSEGHTQKRGSVVTLCQNEDGRAFEGMSKCVGGMPGAWRTYRKRGNQVQFVCFDRGLYQHLRRHCGKGSKNKRIPDYVKAWPAEDLRVLLDALIAGDGSEPVTNANGRWSSTYTTVSGQLADDVMEVAIKCGLSASIFVHKAYEPGRLTPYIVRMSAKTEISVQKHHHKIVPYNGLVWCVEVPTGKFVVRRNGKAHITGNCTPHDPQQINADIQLDWQCCAISPNEIRALRGRKAWPHGGDNPMTQGPGGLIPLPWNKREELDRDVADLIGYYGQHASGQAAQQEVQQQQQQQGQQGGAPGPVGFQPGQSIEEMDNTGASSTAGAGMPQVGAEPGTEGQPEDLNAGIAKPNGKPSKGFNGMDKGAKEYIRLTFNAASTGGGKKKTVWAIKLGPGRYKKCDNEGSSGNEYILLGPGDLIKEEPAQMNMHYGELEVKLFKGSVTKKPGPHKYQSTQINLPGDLGVAARRWVDGHIPEEALLKVEDQSHVTARYGIKGHTNGKV